MVRFALPSITAQVVNILYSVVDRIYIGHLPDGASLALTGIGVCYPILTVISAFSLFAGSGGAPLAAIQLGKSEHDSAARARAESILGNSFFLLLVFSVLLTTGFLIFRRPVLFAFGASAATIPYAESYLSVYLLGMIEDIISAVPMGTNIFTLLVMYILLNNLGRFFYGKPFVITWYGFAALSFVSFFSKWLMVSIYYGQFLPGPAAFFSFLVTIAAYPVLSLMNAFVQSYLVQDEELP